jgi:hypothetical protein
MKPIDNIDMRKIDLEIKKDESLYAQCNFCFSIKETFSLRGEGLTYVTCICKECITKIKEFKI